MRPKQRIICHQSSDAFNVIEWVHRFTECCGFLRFFNLFGPLQQVKEEEVTESWLLVLYGNCWVCRIFLLAYLTLIVYNFDMECASKAKATLLQIGCTKKRSAEDTITNITLGSALKNWFEWAIAVLSYT